METSGSYGVEIEALQLCGLVDSFTDGRMAMLN